MVQMPLKDMRKEPLFWATVGAFLWALNLFVYLSAYGNPSLFSFIQLLSLPFIFFYSLRASLAFSAFYALFALVNFSDGTTFIEFGVAASAITCCNLLALCFKECSQLLEERKSKVEQQFSQILKLDDLAKQLEGELELERRDKALSLQKMEQEHGRIQGEKLNYRDLILEQSLSIEELFATKEEMLAELYRGAQARQSLETDLELARMNIEELEAYCSSHSTEREKQLSAKLVEEKNKAQEESQKQKALLADLALLEEKLAALYKLYEKDLCSKQTLEREVKLQAIFLDAQVKEKSSLQELLSEKTNSLEAARKKLNLLSNSYFSERKKRFKYFSKQEKDKKLKKSFLDELNRLRAEKFQLKLFLQDQAKSKNSLNDNLRKKIKTDLRSIDLEPEEVDRLKQTEALYKQLSEQFREKNEVLHRTRVELFKLEGDKLSAEQALEQVRCEDKGERKYYLEQLNTLEQEAKKLEEEVQDLDQLVSFLMGKVRKYENA